MLSNQFLSSAPSALPPLNIHPHHKKGSHVESAGDSSSDTAAQVPASAAQNLFGSLLRSLEQVIGVQSSTATPAAVATPAATAASAAAATSAVTGASSTGSTTAATASTSAASAVTTSTQSASALLQNYLGNLSQKADGAQLQKLAGSNVSVNA